MKSWSILLSASLFLLLTSAALSAQNTFPVQKTVEWPAEPYRYTNPSGIEVEVWNCTDGQHNDNFRTLPVIGERFALSGNAKISVEVTAVQWASFSKKAAPEDALLTNSLTVLTSVEQVKDQYFGRVRVVPVRKVGSSFERALSYTLTVRTEPVRVEPTATDRGGPHTFTSVLNDGDVYKFGVENSGMYRLDFDYLKNVLKISNLENIDPRTIKLYGNGGYMLPEKNNVDRPDDLLENAIQIVGEEDGKFDAGDYILFYAVGPNPWVYVPDTTQTRPQISVRKHLYDKNAYYFIKISAGNGLRLGEQPNVDGASAVLTTEYDDYRRLEEEKVNLLDFFNSTQGSGKRWFGDYFYQSRSKDYTALFDFGSDVSTAAGSARLRAEFAARSSNGSTVRVTADGLQFSRTVSGVNVSNNEQPFAANGVLGGAFTPKGNKISMLLNYDPTSVQSEGWLDYIEINVRRALAFSGNQMEFRDVKSVANDVTTFQIANAGTALNLWDVTQINGAKRQVFATSGNNIQFNATTKGVLKNYIAFQNPGNLPKPETAVGKIENQNVHSLDNLHFVVIYPQGFEEAAQKLADHRRTYSKMDVATVRIDQLYNEFSSGAKDPTAIRDFAKMLLERNSKFDYLLLLGDGSFDPKNNSAIDNNVDLVPVFETAESFDPITAHPSDDYFGLLSDGEGGSLDGGLDIAVGRIPANVLEEALNIVDKIIAYDNSPQTLGDWHLRLLYLADDGDSNAHINQADKLATSAENTEKWFNSEKIYFDAYQQVATSAGQRFPDAKAAINSNVFKGALIMQYIGHGGPRGWAQERVVDNSDIAGWDNPNRYPFIITATCTFGGYDDPSTVSGGEQSLLKVNSGAVGLFTTVRPVYIDGNNQLTNAIQKVIFQKVNGRYRTVGDILKDGKNILTGGNEDNARRFTLLGDPAMFLALPEYRVVTTKINGNSAGSGVADTLRALQPAEIEGIVTDTLGNHLTSYNGKVTVAIFDKKQTISTLGQDGDSPVRTFSVQRNVLFKGSATVTNGSFKIQFIVPKDIDYKFGNGKIGYYAQDGSPLDAAGGDNSVVIGGNSNQIQDDKAPLVQVFINTDAFVTGGITDKNPKILVKCRDDNGMNVSGTSLGHDLVAVLDDNVQEGIVLNDFYESAQDNYREGKAIYPLRNLAPGRHKVYVKGWDVANNSGDGMIEFVVAEDGKVALDHVMNYPNPFTTSTNFQFEHNLAGQLLDVQVSIFTISGKLVKTIIHNGASPTDGFRVADIAWDGKDDYGDQLAKGVYVYRVKVRGTDTQGNAVTAESNFEKAVILK